MALPPGGFPQVVKSTSSRGWCRRRGREGARSKGGQWLLSGSVPKLPAVRRAGAAKPKGRPPECELSQGRALFEAWLLARGRKAGPLQCGIAWV